MVNYSRLERTIAWGYIVRELIGASSLLRVSRRSLPPPDVAIILHRCKAVAFGNVGVSEAERHLQRKCMRTSSLRVFRKASPTASKGIRKGGFLFVPIVSGGAPTERNKEMKKTIERITSTAILSVAFMLCASSTWAGLVAEWNGDFNVTKKNGWTLTVGTGNTFANGVITIGASSTTPVTIAHSTGYQRVTVVVGIKTSSADTVGTVVSPVYGNDASPYAYLDVENSSSQIWYGWYNGTEYDDDWDKDNTVTWSNDSVQYVTFVADTATASGTEPRGSTIYHNGSVVDGRKNGLVSSSAYVKTIGVGGNPSRGVEGMLNGAVISYVAIYDVALTSSTTPAVASASVPDNLNLMYLISGDTIGASNGIALANDAGYGDVVPTVWASGYRNYTGDSPAGKYGKAARLNGGSLGLVDNTNGLGLNTTDGFTISFWANLPDGTTDQWKSFLGIRVGASNIRLEKQDSANWAMYYFNADTAPSGGDKFSGVSYTASTWAHYALVFAPNNGDITLFKDGSLVKTLAAADNADIHGTLYQVGMGQGRSGSAVDSALRGSKPENAYIDDLAIFKGALSASQISAIATSESAISGPVYGTYRTVSFATPQESVWATANLPNFAKTVTYGSGTVSFANDAYSKSTVNGKAARLTSIVGGSFTEIDGYVKYQETADTTSDVYLRVAGDTTATRINGFGEADYQAGTRAITGNILVNLTGSVVADFVMAAGYKGGSGTALTGNAGVVVDGSAVVRGTLMGGWSSVHNHRPLITGNTYVRVNNVQSTTGNVSEGSIPNGYIMGGSSYQGNYGRSRITGNTSVDVSLGSGATGTFVKNILGGSYGNGGSEVTEVGGSSSVAVTAPNAVTFSGNIIGGCWANSGTASVGGNTSVTLNGGTYTGTIYAGGYGNGTSTVTGNATLTLNGGVYTGATLKSGTATGTKSLVIADNADLSSSTITDSGFGALSVAATKTLTLGTKRLTGNNDPVLASASEGVITLTLTEEEYTAKYAEFLKCEASDVSGQYVIYYNNNDITSEIASKVNVLAGKLTYLDSSSCESTIAAETSVNWDDVIWTKADSSTDTMANVSASPTANATLTLNGTLVIASPVTFAGEQLAITGSGTIKFTGSATLTAAVALNIDSGIALDFSGLTNLTNMGVDTIMSAGNSTVIAATSTVYPEGWNCRTVTSSDSMKICGARLASDVISVNIIGGTLYEGTTWYTGCTIGESNTAGYLPIQGAKWNQTVHASKPAVSSVDVQTDALKEVRSDNSVVTSAGVTMTIKASGPYADFWSGVSRDNEDGNSQLMYGYLDDGEVSDGKGAKIVVNNIPYSEYAVLVYMGTDQKSGSFGCVYANGTGYYGANGLTVEGTSAWGSYASTHGSITLGEGSNYLRIAGLTGSSVTIQGSKSANGNRCGISGVQIVNTGLRGATYSATLEGSDATLLPSGTSTGMTKTSTETWINNGEGKIYLTNPSDATSTVTIGENVSVKVVKIMGAGKVTLAIGAGSALSISGGKIDLSEFSGTLCVDSTVSQTFFEGVSTNGGTVRFLGTGLSFAGAASLPLGRVALKSATLTGDLQLNNRTLVVEDGDSVILNGSNNSRTSMQFAISGGSLTVKGGDFWFGNGSTFTQTGGTVTLESTSTSMSDSGCVIFGFSSGGGTVNISGGTFDMSGATLCLWTGTTSLTLSGNAVFKVKGIWSNASKNVTVGGSSKLILTGTQGIYNNLGSLTMNGGTIEFQETATISEPLTLTSGVESTINIAANKTATISTVALSAAPTGGDKMLATNGGTISINTVTVGGEAQSFDLCYESDGVYVAAAEYNSVKYYSVVAAISVAGDANLADITLLNGCTTVPEGYVISNGHIGKGVAKIGSTYYVTLQEAIAAASDESTVTLLENISLTDRLFVNAGTTPVYGGTNNRYATTSANNAITLDLNGHSITTASNIALAGGSLTITGSGTITTTNGGAAPVEIYGKGDLSNKRTLVIDEYVRLVGGTYGLNIFGSNDAQVNKIDVTVNGTITGTLFVLGNLTNAANEINIVVNGTIAATASTVDDVNVGVALNGNANVTVNDGASISGDSGIEVRAGSLTVKGGTITATAQTYSYKPNGSGSTTKGAAIAIAQHTTVVNLTATLSGGTLVGVEQVGITNVNGSMAGVTVQATSSYTESAEIPAGYKWVETETPGVYTLEGTVGTTFTVY